jgi:hypothetical protein
MQLYRKNIRPCKKQQDKKMADEKRLFAPASASLNPPNLENKDRDSTKYIASFLSDTMLISLQHVNKRWREAAVKTIQERAYKLVEINQLEQKNVWRIYKCLQALSASIPRLPAAPIDSYADIRVKSQANQPLAVAEIQLLQRANLLPLDFQLHENLPVPFPVLPPPPVDPWATLRIKNTLQELTLTEIHYLCREGLLNNYLCDLARNDYEKASLIMESPFLKTRLPAHELRRNCQDFSWLNPSWLSRILGFFLAPVLGIIVTAMTSALFLFSSVPIAVLANLCFCAPCDEDSQKQKMGATHAFWTFFLPIYPVYCFFMGFYLGGKYGLSYSLRRICDLAAAPYSSMIGSLSSEGRKIIDYILIKPPHLTIADMAVNAERVKKREDISKLNITAIAMPSSQTNTLVNAPTATDYTPLLRTNPNSPESSVGYNSFV